MVCRYWLFSSGSISCHTRRTSRMLGIIEKTTYVVCVKKTCLTTKMQFLPKQGLLNKIGWIFWKTTNWSINLNVYPQPLVFTTWPSLPYHVTLVSHRPSEDISLVFFFSVLRWLGQSRIKLFPLKRPCVLKLAQVGTPRIVSCFCMYI